MKLKIEGVGAEPILSEYARISITNSQSVGFNEIHFDKVGKNSLNVNIIKTEEGENKLISQNRNIDVLARKLELVEKIMRIMTNESIWCSWNGKPNNTLEHALMWLDAYINNGGKLDEDAIKIICKTIGKL